MKVYLDSIGCRLNQSEVEKMGNQFRSAGHELVSCADEADVVVVNTCAVTSNAESDSRLKVRQAARVGGNSIVVTGCWATIASDAAKQLPNVTHVFANDKKDDLVRILLNLPEESFELEPLQRKPLPGAHARTRAFVKAQDGCDNHCTYCVTRIARGKSRSRSIRDISFDIDAAIRGGVQEVVITGVHLASWGQDFEKRQCLRQLLESVLEHSDIPRVRLSSLEAWDLDENFFSLWKDKRLCPHLHLPLQSGSTGVLKRMARKITPDQFERVVAWARLIDQDMTITTDIMTGFPGETIEEFNESLSFVEKVGFAAGHVFSYSARPGTAATRLPGSIPMEIRKQRSAVMRLLLEKLSQDYRQRFIGQTRKVLWEAGAIEIDHERQIEGLTDNYIRVAVSSHELLWNKISLVYLDRVTPDGMQGIIIKTPQDV